MKISTVERSRIDVYLYCDIVIGLLFGRKMLLKKLQNFIYKTCRLTKTSQHRVLRCAKSFIWLQEMLLSSNNFIYLSSQTKNAISLVYNRYFVKPFTIYMKITYLTIWQGRAKYKKCFLKMSAYSTWQFVEHNYRKHQDLLKCFIEKA